MRRICARSYYARRFNDSDREDFVSTVVERYYATEEFDRPQTEELFEAFCYETIQELAGKVRRLQKSEISPEGYAETHAADGNHGKALEHPMEAILGRYGSIGTIEQPRQENYMQCMDVLRSISKTSEGQQETIRRLFDCGSVVEFAKDSGISLFDAMNEQARIREIVKRIVEDDADERKFGDAAV